MQPTPYPLRISAELREQLEDKAKESGRSLNQEITHQITASINKDASDKAVMEKLDALEKMIIELTEKIDEMKKD
jgi:hypothetical protein